jgi:hypothetical protein
MRCGAVVNPRSSKNGCDCPCGTAAQRNGPISARTDPLRGKSARDLWQRDAKVNARPTLTTRPPSSRRKRRTGRARRARKGDPSPADRPRSSPFERPYPHRFDARRDGV